MASNDSAVYESSWTAQVLEPPLDLGFRRRGLWCLDTLEGQTNGVGKLGGGGGGGTTNLEQTPTGKNEARRSPKGLIGGAGA